MSTPLRSKQGCWTCRLRKKKCDEGHPNCSLCKSLSVTCYGYGPKPTWMNNGDTERAVADGIKDIVKHTSRRKATTKPSEKSSPLIMIAPKSLMTAIANGSPIAELNRQHDVTLPSVTQKLPPISTNEFSLLMHFLDNVFPLQYPMYKPKTLEGGRGWLLALLLQTKASYHAVMALSGHYCRTILAVNVSCSSENTAFLQQEQHLQACIKLLNQSAQNGCPYKGLDVIFAMIQMMFFELFTGRSNAWQAHFNAATNLYQLCYEKNLAQNHANEKSRTTTSTNLSLLELETVIAQEIVAFRFLGGTMIWHDVLFSITAGKAPNLLHYHSSVIAPDSKIELEAYVGCKSWVIVQIGRIAALHERGTQTSQGEQVGCEEFARTEPSIASDIQYDLIQSSLKDLDTSKRTPTTNCTVMSDTNNLVTQLFAHMATVYLHLVIYGFQKLETVDRTISKAMDMLQTRISEDLLPALVCPLYILGCTARRGDEDFFRAIFSSHPLLNPSLKHRERILPVLEKVWSRRQTMSNFSWNDSLGLTHEIMLL